MAKKYKPKRRRQEGITYELTVIEGIEHVALTEIEERLKSGGKPVVKKGAIELQFEGNPSQLLQLDTIIAAYQIISFDVPRPKALLGHQHFTRLVEHINTIRGRFEITDFRTIHINAAGRRSSVMQRLVDELSSATGLSSERYEGDLLIRLRPSKDTTGWEALIRISPRPNSTRTWRVENYKGALNASVAHAMVRLSEPTPEDTVLNMLAGSGTLAIERLCLMSANRVIACEINHETLSLAEANIVAADMKDRVELTNWDAKDLPLPIRSVDAIFADLPFGNYVGSHDGNIELYPALVKEAARILKRNGHFVLITHELKLFGEVLVESGKFRVKKEIRVNLNGLHPHIYVLGLA